MQPPAQTLPDDLPVDVEEVAAVLRDASAVCAFLHGSWVDGRASDRSDVDVAALFDAPVDGLAVGARLPGRVDLLVLDTAPAELAGRVALHGLLLLDTDPPRRVEWVATTRKLHLDERFRRDAARADFVAAHRPRG